MTDAKRRVLVVDDDADFLFQLKLQFEAEGYEVIQADGVEKALSMLPSAKFDVAVIDLMMEENDGGFILSREIKKKGSDIPVIIVTAVASETGMEFGASTKEEKSWIKADAMLAKPIRFEQLTREINRLLKG
jgi:CheY-like chemotaxis protein